MGKQPFTTTMSVELGSPRRGCGWRKNQLLISVTMVALMCAMVIVLMAMYSLKPSTVELTALSVPKFEALLKYPQVEWNSTWHMDVKITNGERRWGADYDEVVCSLYNEERRLRKIGWAKLEPFSLESGEERTERVRMQVEGSRTMGGWEFHNFSVRLQAYAHFRIQGSGIEQMLVGKCRHVDAICSGITVLFHDQQGTLQHKLSRPNFCDGEVHLNKAIATQDDDNDDDAFNNR